jgi:cAMP-specific phosphodiesterase 4
LQSYSAIEKIISILEQDCDNWGLNIFLIDELSRGKSLTIVTYYIIEKRGLIDTLNIPRTSLVNYLLKLEASYRQLPYHNNMHAADVVHTAHYLLNSNSLEDVLTDLDVFAVIMASALHDVDHRGYTNKFLKLTNDPLVVKHGNSSPLERHHIEFGLGLLRNSSFDFTANMTAGRKKRFKCLIEQMVLATDIELHAKQVEELVGLLQRKTLSETKNLVIGSANDATLLLRSLLHCADLSNPLKPCAFSMEWTCRIYEEFFNQGDEERRRVLPLSPNMDR